MTRYARGYKKSYEDASSWDEMNKNKMAKKASTPANKESRESSLVDSTIPGKESKMADKASKKREARRKRRQKSKVCFGCRGYGHALAECPTMNNKSKESQICFSCGSSEHTLKNCKERKAGLPFAKCFVCGDVGHLSGQCPKNSNGLYPNGGGCKGCGSTMHLKKDCPELKQTSSKSEGDKPRVTVSKRSSAISSVDSIELDTEEITEVSNKKKKPKIVKF